MPMQRSARGSQREVEVEERLVVDLAVGIESGGSLQRPGGGVESGGAGRA